MYACAGLFAFWLGLTRQLRSKPRPVDATSIPALLSLMQNEWDAFVLESFELKKHLHQTRQELSHALYQCVTTSFNTSCLKSFPDPTHLLLPSDTTPPAA